MLGGNILQRSDFEPLSIKIKYRLQRGIFGLKLLRLSLFKLSFIPLIFLALLVFLSNILERTSEDNFFDKNVYSFKQLENFVNSVSVFTPGIDEESSIVASELAFNSSSSDQEFIERLEVSNGVDVALTQAAQTSSEAPQKKEFITYEVTSSDTVSGIASKFGIKVKTLASANNLTSVDHIKPQDKLLVPPTDGLVHTVSSGETLSSLAKKYQGNLSETIKHNSEAIKIGQKVIIVDGKEFSAPQTTKLASQRSVIARDSGNSRGTTLITGSGGKDNGYAWGWCTWYAAYRRKVGRNWGNAKNWLNSARAAGYSTGGEPSVGAIVVTTESWWGHLGIVDNVRGDTITISEMNYKGFGVISSRSISKYSSFIRGYIY